MDTILPAAPGKASISSRIMRNPVVRIVLGVVLTFAAVPLTMITASRLVDKSYRVMWPQLLAAVLVWFGYRFWVRHIEKREATELSATGMGRELGKGILLGAALVAATFGILAALGVYRLEGLNALGWFLIVPLAELLLVGLAEEMMFRGVVFGVTERALGSTAAIVISALVFSVAHLPNDGVSVLAVAVLAAYGVLQAAIYMKTRRLWACIGTHIAWNYSVGHVFSSTVSGHAADAGLLRGELSGSALLTGGAFGIEASLVTLLVIAACAVLWLRRRN